MAMVEGIFNALTKVNKISTLVSEKHFNPRAKSEVSPRAVQGANQSTARPVLFAILSVEQQILRGFPEVAVSLLTFVRD